MYCIFALVMVGITITQGDFGEMLDAEHRSRKEGKLPRDDAVPMQSAENSLGNMFTDSPPFRFFLLPVGTLITVVFTGGAYTGVTGAGSDAEPVDIVGNAAFTDALLWGSFSMVGMGLVSGTVSGLLDLEEAMETVIGGFSTMLTAASILVMAWTIDGVTGSLGTGVYVTNVAEAFISPMLLPIVIIVASAMLLVWGATRITPLVLLPVGVGVLYGLV